MTEVVASIAAETVGLPFDIAQVLKSADQQNALQAGGNSLLHDELLQQATNHFPANRSLLLTAVGLASLMAAAPATAQDSGVQLPTIDVTGDQSGDSPDNTLQSNTGVSRLGRVQDIPQTVTVINQQTLREQGVTTLDQALRNVPGVTVAIGEGNGGVNGDQFRIRGFQAKGDVYTDGLRDFGTYTRDSFAYEQIQVLKGPSSESFGVGTTGGAINNVMKNAKLGNFMDFEGTLGMGPLYRGVLDVNRQINADHRGAHRRHGPRSGHRRPRSAVQRPLGRARFGRPRPRHRHHADPQLHAPGRPPGAGHGAGDHHANRPDRPPDFRIRRQPLELLRQVDRHGRHQRRHVHGALQQGSKRLADDFERHPHRRYDRYFTQTVTSCPAPACVNGVAAGNQNVAYAFGGPAGYRQVTWGAQNITTGGRASSTPARCAMN